VTHHVRVEVYVGHLDDRRTRARRPFCFGISRCPGKRDQ
jgi:hypothetical protein